MRLVADHLGHINDLNYDCWSDKTAYIVLAMSLSYRFQMGEGGFDSYTVPSDLSEQPRSDVYNLMVGFKLKFNLLFMVFTSYISVMFSVSL